jgi:hypothetical protein
MSNPATQFKPGQSGNPAGRPKLFGEMTALARAKCPEAIECLYKIMNDVEAPHAARVSAADKLLDRGLGKPPQTVNLKDDKEADELTDDELDRRILTALERIEAIALGAATKAKRQREPQPLH